MARSTATFTDGGATDMRLGNRLLGEIVWVRTRGLLLTGVVVAPRDADVFERDLNRAIEAHHRREWP